MNCYDVSTVAINLFVCPKSIGCLPLLIRKRFFIHLGRRIILNGRNTEQLFSARYSPIGIAQTLSRIESQVVSCLPNTRVCFHFIYLPHITPGPEESGSRVQYLGTSDLKASILSFVSVSLPKKDENRQRYQYCFQTLVPLQNLVSSFVILFFSDVPVFF